MAKAKSKSKNILLLFLSTMAPPGTAEIDLAPKRQHYLIETGIVEEDCVQTNEAVVYNVVNLLKSKKETLDAIYFFATDQVQHQEMRIVDGGQVVCQSITQRAFWEKRWRERYKELSRTKFYCVDYKYPTEDVNDVAAQGVNLPEESSRRVAEMAEAVKSFSGPDSGRRKWKTYALYVDITGGFRHATMMMTSLVQLLQYDGMKLKKLLYSDFQPGRVLNRVFDFTEIGRQYRLISGAEEFARFGSVYNIEKYFGARYDPQTNTLRMEMDTTPALESLLLAMHQFSDAIHLCATNKIQDCMEALRRSVATFRDNPSPSPRENLFRQLLDTIQEKYGKLLQENAWETDIIHWCLDMGFYQQALTLYVEWMPIVFVREKILYPAREKDVIAAYQDAARKSLKGSNSYSASWQRFFITQYPYIFRKESYRKNLDAMLQAGEALVANNMVYDATLILRHYMEINSMRNAVNHAGANDISKGIDEIVQIIQQRLKEIENFCDALRETASPDVLSALSPKKDIIKPSATQEETKECASSDEQKEGSTCASSTIPTTLPNSGETPSGQLQSDSGKSWTSRFPQFVPNGAKRTWRWRRIRQPGGLRPCIPLPFFARENPPTAFHS